MVRISESARAWYFSTQTMDEILLSKIPFLCVPIFYQTLLIAVVSDYAVVSDDEVDSRRESLELTSSISYDGCFLLFSTNLKKFFS